EDCTIVLILYQFPEINQKLYHEGISVNISPMRRDEKSLVAGLKTLSYVQSIAALKEAKDGGFDDAVLVDTNNFLSEATTSNLFVCLNGIIMTPDRTHGILPGVTRSVVLEIAK